MNQMEIAQDEGGDPRPAVTVDMILFVFQESALRVLLIRRSHEPFLGKWALPGGFGRRKLKINSASVVLFWRPWSQIYSFVGLVGS